ncbi:MAG: hypothetical protein IIY93_04085 [Clostridia bacterium]|nr:hypothetical protein [Clostridia bacterium]
MYCFSSLIGNRTAPFIEYASVFRAYPVRVIGEPGNPFRCVFLTGSFADDFPRIAVDIIEDFRAAHSCHRKRKHHAVPDPEKNLVILFYITQRGKSGFHLKPEK